MTQPTTWAKERERAYNLFGGTSPSTRDEADIAQAFTNHPAAIIAEIANLGHAYTAGKVHTPWRALHSKLAKIASDERQVDFGQETRVRLAENWIRNAGHHCPNEAEVTHELFESTSALLKGLEPQFGEQMRALWRHERPRGTQAEADLLERGRRYREWHNATKAPTLAEALAETTT